MRKFLIFLFIFLLLPVAAICETVLPAERGLVKEVSYIDIDSLQGNESQQVKQKVLVKILSGKFKGELVDVDNMITSNPAYDILLTKGDRVILHLEPKSEFVEDLDDVEIFISDLERVNALYVLVFIFFALLIFIGRKKGVSSFLSILTTVMAVFFVLKPLILLGFSPIISATVVCVLSTIITVYLVGGFNRKSSAAIFGTVGSLVFAGILSIITINIANLTGFAGEENIFLYAARPDLNFTGILSAAIMLAALGAVMDVGVSISSTINEIHETDNSLSVKELFNSGMNVGRDIIGTMSNTLILVYLGSALPLVLLSSNIDLNKFFNLNQVATEISSALIGSIGILVCVPLTAIISAWIIKRKSNKED